MKIANTRKITEQLGKCLNRQEVNRLLGIAVTNPVNGEPLASDKRLSGIHGKGRR